VGIGESCDDGDYHVDGAPLGEWPKLARHAGGSGLNDEGVLVRFTLSRQAQTGCKQLIYRLTAKVTDKINKWLLKNTLRKGLPPVNTLVTT
jgi:hypothetical protein